MLQNIHIRHFRYTCQQVPYPQVQVQVPSTHLCKPGLEQKPGLDYKMGGGSDLIVLIDKDLR